MAEPVQVQKASARWTEDGSFTVLTETGCEVRFDSAGPKPTEMLLGALAACVGMTLLGILKGFQVSSLQIKAEGKRSVQIPTVFTEFMVMAMIQGDDLPPDRVAKAIEAVERECPVLQTLSKAAPIRFRYVLG